MLDTDKQVRFATSCSEAAFGYAAAASAAYGALAADTLEYWKRTFLPEQPKPEPRSWYRHPDVPQPRKASELPLALLPWAPFLAAFGTPAQASQARAAGDPMTMLMNAWAAAPTALFDMWSMQRAPVAWPMAFFMMSAGLPRAVAVPAAEANAAALDAARIARDALHSSYSSYRSDGGHAVAHVVYSCARDRTGLGLMALAVPLATAATWPWLAPAAHAAS